MRQNCHDLPIEELGTRIRLYNRLQRERIKTVGGVLRLLRRGRECFRREGSRSVLAVEYSVQDILEGLEKIGCMPDDLPLGIDVRTQSKRIAWIIQTQRDNGSWYDDLDTTTAALISVVREQDAGRDVLHKDRLAQGIAWLENRTLFTDDASLTYAITRTLAEYNKHTLPIPPLDTTYFEGKHDTDNLSELRLIALINGDAIKINKYPMRPENRLGATYTYTEIAWMAVGKPITDQ